MERKKELFKILSCIVVLTTAIIVSRSLCPADVLPSSDSEMMAAFSNFMDTELGDDITALLEEKGLEVNLENGLNNVVLGEGTSIVPLMSTDFQQMTTHKESHQKPQFLAYINHEMLGRFLVFIEVIKNRKNEMPSSVKIIFPSGRGFVLNINPFYIRQIDTSKTGISLQYYDDLENTIIVSDACEVLGIIATVLATVCGIYPDPILCAIAAAMETVYQFLCS